jgi:hypothetical protein
VNNQEKVKNEITTSLVTVKIITNCTLMSTRQ